MSCCHFGPLLLQLLVVLQLLRSTDWYILVCCRIATMRQCVPHFRILFTSLIASTTATDATATVSTTTISTTATAAATPTTATAAQKVKGGWGAWSNWTACSATCGGGNTSATRQCDSPPPSGGGAYCAGSAYNESACNTQPCPGARWLLLLLLLVHEKAIANARTIALSRRAVNGSWSNWTAMPCSVTCGVGIAMQTRTCTNPAPANGGAQCSGASYQFVPCYLTYCPGAPRLP